MRCHLIAALLLPIAFVTAQEGVYYDVPVAGLTITEGELPESDGDYWFLLWRMGLPVRVVLDGPGEAYFDQADGNNWQPVNLGAGRIVVRVPEAGAFSGQLLFKDHRIRFSAPAGLEPAGVAEFDAVRHWHLANLLDSGYAGGAWWRYQQGDGPEDAGPDNFGRSRDSDITRTYDFMSGGRALRENLQLERGLPGGERAAEDVEIASIRGVTVKKFDWTSYLEGAEPDPDPLAASIPADQYALFFPSFQAMLDVLDLADSNGTPAVQIMEASAQDAQTKARYEQQLCLQTNALSRLFGPQLIASIAATGSDPFLREGSDIAILFEAKDADTLEKLLTANRIAHASLIDTTTVDTDIEGVRCQRITSVDRRVDSIQFRIGDVLAVTNSLAQARRIITAEQHMDSLDEYRYFRSRYQRDGESAFLMITDDAIRRWCSPQWRIAMSRRVRASAALAMLDAEHAEALITGEGIGTALANDFRSIDLGELKLTADGANSSTYGSTDFLTPISELGLNRATTAESQGYERWRDGYERNWSNFFDPIGVQLKITDDQILTDLTVMPLIVGSDYNQLIDTIGESKIRPGAGNPHDGRLFQVLMAFDKDSAQAEEIGGFIPSAPGAKAAASPLDWVGETISFSIEAGDLFAEAAQAEDPQEFFEQNLPRLPMLLHVDVGNPLIAAAFLTGLRSMVEMTAHGYTDWSTHDHGDAKYVRIAAGDNLADEDELEDLALHYATLKGVLLFGIDPDTFKAGIDRHQEAKGSDHVWLGEHLACRVRRDALRMLDLVAPEDGYRGELRRETFLNLPILNEWRRMFPDHDALETHRRITGTRLVCAGGGELVWNQDWQTYESTAFGHPGAPKAGPSDCLPFAGWTWGEFGLTFESDGLRARAAVSK